MKKFFLLLAVVSASVASYAQEDDDIIAGEKHSVVTNSFWANWFVQGNITWNAFYGVGETSLVAPFRKFPTGEGHTGLGFSAAVGKWFTPGIGLRAKVSGWRMGSKDANGNNPEKYMSGTGEVLFNVSNMILGYDEQRFWNAIPYVGAGIYKQGSYRSMLSIGLLNTFRLTNRLAANLELGWGSMDCGKAGLNLKNRLQHYSLEVGLTYRLGNHKWKAAPDMEAYRALTQGELDALNAQLADAVGEISNLNKQLDDARKNPPLPVYSTKVVKQETAKVVSAPVSIFFELGKSVSAAPRDLENVAALAKTARENNLHVVVTGYADTKTGTPEGNMKISQKRADAVADQLVKLGVSRDMITTVAAGGVNTLANSDFNRRVVVELKE